VCHAFAIICGIRTITWIDVGGGQDMTLPPPSRTAAAAERGLWLGTGTDVTALEQKIVSAMGANGSLAVAFWPGMFGGEVVLRGATLAYAVLRPQAPTA